MFMTYFLQAVSLSAYLHCIGII